jgi:hypothetical protein
MLGLLAASLGAALLLGWSSPEARAATSTTGDLAAVTNAATLTSQSTAKVQLDLVPGAIFGVRQPTVAGDGAFDFASRVGKVSLRESTGTETVVYIPEALYVHEPPSHGPSSLPAGKTWISVGLAEIPAAGSSIPQFVDQAEAVNAGFLLDEIAWGTVSARRNGQNEIGGSSASSFRVTVDLRQAAANASGPTAPVFGRAVGYQIAALATGTGAAAAMHATVWTGSNGRIVRIQSSPPGSGVGSTTLTFLAGRPKSTVGAPPSAKVVDIASLTPGGEQESGLGDVA